MNHQYEKDHTKLEEAILIWYSKITVTWDFPNNTSGKPLNENSTLTKYKSVDQ